MKKKVFLAVALITLMTGVLSAQTYDSESDFQVTKTGNAITITKYVGKKTTVSIPPNIQNTPVTAIGNESFKSAGITSVTIPNGVKTIGGGAFYDNKLTSVTIPNSVTTIDNAAFNGNSLTSVTFQGTINFAAFQTGAFGNDGALRTKFYAVGSTTQGTPGTYTRPNSSSNTWTMTPVATTAASSGDSESDFTVRVNGNAITITKYVGSKKAVTIPPRIQNLPVTIIGSGAFRGTSITSVILPSGVTSIGAEAFARCGLTSITIPNTVTSIGNTAFAMSSELASITIPASVTKIGDGAFDGCSINSVTFSGTIASSEFSNDGPFPGDLRAKFYATDKAKGTPGTYTRPNGTSTTWTKK